MQDELDKLIDGALAEYSAAEPLSGLEERVLARARASKAERRRRWWWALAVPAAAAAIFLAIPARKPVTAPVAKVIVPPPPAVIAPSPETARVAPRRRARVRKAQVPRELPKQQAFPTASPLTPEERLLVQLAQSHPEALTAAPAAEIEIKPIQIAPLQIDGTQ